MKKYCAHCNPERAARQEEKVKQVEIETQKKLDAEQAKAAETFGLGFFKIGQPFPAFPSFPAIPQLPVLQPLIWPWNGSTPEGNFTTIGGNTTTGTNGIFTIIPQQYYNTGTATGAAVGTATGASTLSYLSFDNTGVHFTTNQPIIDVPVTISTSTSVLK